MKYLIGALLVGAAFCAPRDQLASTLKERYGETVRVQALDVRDNMVEMFANEDTGTWTAVATTPDLMSCVIGSGHSFQAVAAVPAGTLN